MSNQHNNSSLSEIVATGKDLVAMLRDALQLLMAVLLIGWPHRLLTTSSWKPVLKKEALLV